LALLSFLISDLVQRLVGGLVVLRQTEVNPTYYIFVLLKVAARFFMYMDGLESPPRRAV
jgi:hypothetical protein